MKNKSCITLLLTAIMLMILPVSCTDEEKEQPITPDPPIEMDRSNMFGIRATVDLGNNIGSTGSDVGVTKELIADLCGALGVKSFRMDMFHHWLLEFDDNGVLKFKGDHATRYREYIDLLKDNGIVKILAVCPSYIYPFGYERTHWQAIPEPGTEAYIKFLEVIEEAYRLFASEFPEINYFEYGNEINAPNGHNMKKNGYKPNGTPEENAPYIFTDSELALITADIGYYATRGIKAGNPEAKAVMSGLWVYTTAPEMTRNHLGSIYEQIKSGKLPSTRMNGGAREIPANTNPSSYFEYLNWHTYFHGEHTMELLRMNKSFYQVALDHGDVGRKVFITEFGYFDSFLERREELIANVCVPAIKALTEYLPAIESVFIFQMFNWTQAGSDKDIAEKSYGIFDSPLQPKGVRPKPVAISLFYHYNGVNANSDPLFKYMK